MKYTFSLGIISLILSLMHGTSFGQNSSKKFIFTYDNVGNRTKREVCDGCIVRKDPIKDAAPISQDSLLLTAMDNEPNIGQNTTKDELKNDIWKTWIGHQEIDIYPNPTQGYLSIGLKNFEDITDCLVEVVDMKGTVVYSSTSKQRVHSMDLGSYPAGNYYINLRINGMLGSFVVVKQ